MEKYITLPLTLEKVKDLHAGDTVYLTGTIYTSRDAGHKRMCEMLARGEALTDVVHADVIPLILEVVQRKAATSC